MATPALAAMALQALRELVGGFPADATAPHDDLRPLQRDLIGLVTRSVFRLHAEARGLLADDSLFGLGERLDADAAGDADALAQRRTAWPELLARVRELGGDEPSRLLAGPGDGAVLRALRALRGMDDPRGWYGALDLDALGGVYEALIDYRLLRTRGPGLVARPGVVDLAELLSHAPAERARRFTAAGGVLDASLQAALAAATTPADVAAAVAERRGARAMQVLPPGSLYLQPGEERRRAGAHYTPRGLADPIVRVALRPLLSALGERPTPGQLLDLKLCDPAAGCGAFLLAACRQLGERLEQAWRDHGVVIPPADDAGALARRQVALHCLYGVDKDPCAVDLTRLSLWLLTGAEGSLRHFMAAAVRCGDALVGLGPAQIAAFSWDPDARGPTGRAVGASVHSSEGEPVRPPTADAVHSSDRARTRTPRDATDNAHSSGPEPPRPPAAPGACERVHRSGPERPRPPAASGERVHASARERARRVGDAAVAVFFAHDGDRRREEQRERLARATVEPARRGDLTALAVLDRLAAGLAAGVPAVLPFHWELEFPAVFARDPPGFDGFVGNPPFFWGNRISRAFGDRYRDWLLRCYPGSHGNSDLAAYFLRRSFALLRRGGALGFVTTNSIAEADTRATGLEPLLRAGGIIYEAVRSAEWDGSASVRVAHVFVAKGGDPGERRLDGEVVAEIGADLRRPRAAWTAVRLRERAEESYKGVDFGGTGFLLTAEQRDAIIRAAPHEAACIRPVLNASTFTASPQQRPAGFIINFTGLSLAEAERYAQCMAIVRERVLPRRALDKRKARRERWWLYNEACVGLYRAIAGKARVLVCPVVAKYVTFALVEARAVFTNALNVFTFDDHASLAVLQSRVHELWALTQGSSLRADPRYNPSDCFETFPFPAGWQHSAALADAGRSYDECRRRCMIAGDHGLTSLYNRFHDPEDRAGDVAELRELHAALDRAVLAAYGWTDLAAQAEAEFRRRDESGRITRPTIRLEWPAAFADELLGRLLALNQRRAERPASATVAPRPGS
ncbi:Eco57I restriction-modification methylase domain-containing protein [Nannocystis exedens]|uniref:Eco57I restriction-modification methylase domain-containing protein n=1 Tax=Nannocystis exedens TaxID=54 RepID=UPI000BBA05E0|nr:type IIL restriction-modification enzyme MmeI [Nannocystis exedens]